MFNDSYNFNNLIERSIKRLNKRYNEPFYIKNYISKLNNYVQVLKKENPNLTLSELENIFENDFTEILDTIFSNDSSLYYAMAYESCIYLSSRPKKFNELLKEISDNPESVPKDYSSNFNGNLKLFISELKEDYDTFLSDDFFKQPAILMLRDKLLDDNVSTTEKSKTCNHIYSQLNFNTKKYLKKYIDCIKNGEFGFLQHEIKLRENDLKENLVLSVSSIGKQLEKLGFLEKYPIFQEACFKKIGLSGFAHPLKSSKNILGIDRLSNSNYLSGLPFDTLLALNNSWCNRFVKESDTYIESIYAIRQLNLLPKMLDGTFNPEELSIDDIKNVLIKMNLFYTPTKNYWNYACSLDEDKIEITRFEGKNYHLMSNDDLKYLLKDCIEKEYSQYFSELLPNNNINEDLDDYWKLYTPIMNAYSFKDTSFLSTLALSQSLNLSPNYGIVIDKNFPFTPEDSKYYQVNFWMDFKGLNFPSREHIPMTPLINFLKDFYGNCKVPLYIGSEAFTNIPSHILFPFNKEQISVIKNAKKDNYEGYSEKATSILKHSSYLLNPKSAKKDIDKLFIDLEDFELYIKDENGNYKKKPESILIKNRKPKESNEQLLS